MRRERERERWSKGTRVKGRGKKEETERVEENVPKSAINPVPDAKQVMTNNNRFQEQVW
jgi:hypothetical protein